MSSAYDGDGGRQVLHLAGTKHVGHVWNAEEDPEELTSTDERSYVDIYLGGAFFPLCKDCNPWCSDRNQSMKFWQGGKGKTAAL